MVCPPMAFWDMAGVTGGVWPESSGRMERLQTGNTIVITSLESDVYELPLVSWYVADARLRICVPAGVVCANAEDAAMSSAINRSGRATRCLRFIVVSSYLTIARYANWTSPLGLRSPFNVQRMWVTMSGVASTVMSLPLAFFFVTFTGQA